jgi:hypothetical protein
MALFEGKTPAERNKLIAAGAFGLIALLLLGRMFFGSSGSTSTTNVNRSRAGATRGGASGSAARDAQNEEQIATVPKAIPHIALAGYTGGEPGRNIFALFTRPAPIAAQTPEVELPPATPTPTPPLMLSALSPQSVYAQTGEFRMQVSGDKFTPESRVHINEQEVPTQFVSAQQLTATVPAFQITSPGTRTIIVHTPDRLLYSNTATLNVMQPPMPQYTYIGYVQRRDGQEFATLRDQGNKQKMYRLNEVVGKELQGGERFRITGISPKIVELTDTELKIKHPITYVEASRAGSNPAQRNSIPPPKAEDDEGGGDEEP